ncbi:hypothetical protein BDW71DRAFT_208920 [Aspergillus fruticulosus]
MLYDRGEAVLKALLGLRADHLLRGSWIYRFYDKALQKISTSPGRDVDQLFVAEYSHAFSEPSRQRCDPSMLRQRLSRSDDQPRVFCGLIASGDKVIKEAKVRSQLGKQCGILCFETEAARIMDIFPCLIISGVCDYAGSYKHKRWQGYVAVVAATYAKELLLYLPPMKMVDTICEERIVDSQLVGIGAPALADLTCAPSPTAATRGSPVKPKPRK